ncbi:MAG: 30S ribosomal protein S8 [Thiotrichales bacterium]
MSMSDPVADMLTRVRNAQAILKTNVSMPSSKLKVSVATVLRDEGYISGFAVSDDIKPVLTIELKYYLGRPVISTLTRISKPGLRVYRGKGDLPSVVGGLGISILSTSQGVMSDRAARALGQGGEVICTVS